MRPCVKPASKPFEGRKCFLGSPGSGPFAGPGRTVRLVLRSWARATAKTSPIGPCSDRLARPKSRLLPHVEASTTRGSDGSRSDPGQDASALIPSHRAQGRSGSEPASEAPLEKFHRGVRRHHRARLMQVRKGYHGGAIGRRKSPQGVLSFWSRTPTPCSCWMCGNPRRLGEATIQERRAFQAIEV